MFNFSRKSKPDAGPPSDAKPKVRITGHEPIPQPSGVKPTPATAPTPAAEPETPLVKISGKAPLAMPPPSPELPADPKPDLPPGAPPVVPPVAPPAATSLPHTAPAGAHRTGLVVTITPLDPAGRRYMATGTSSLAPHLSAREEMVLPYTKADLDAILRDLGQKIDNPRAVLDATMPVLRSDPAQPAAGVPPTDGHLLTTVGKELFSALFHGALETLYIETLDAATTQFPVVIETEATEVARQPWELMYDGYRYLCTDVGPIYRVVPRAGRIQPDILLPAQFKVLVSASNPPGTVVIDWEREADNIRSALARTSHDLLAPGLLGIRKFRETLLQYRPHVLHFIGHGDEQGNLLFSNDNGQPIPVGDVLAEMAGTLGHDMPRVIILNACSTAVANPATNHPGLAARLVRNRVPMVVATQFRISDPAAAAFARGFYEYVAAGKPVQKATAWGRLVIKSELRETVEWATPVVYAHPSLELG